MSKHSFRQYSPMSKARPVSIMDDFGNDVFANRRDINHFIAQGH